MVKWDGICGQKNGAGNGARTRDLNLGKVALYQLSYSRVVSEAGLEPARAYHPRDFKSLVSTCSTTPAGNKMEATPGFEPGIKVLQTSALPLGYVAPYGIL